MAQISELTLGKKDGEFSSCWIAGANLSQNALVKTFKRHEIDNIDVANLCDKLRVLNKRFRSSFTSDNSTGSNETLHLPFKVYSRLVFGTLVILKEQVNHLLVDTERLMKTNMSAIATIDQYNQTQEIDHSIKSRKRKLCSNVNIVQSTLSFKKRRKNADSLISYATLLDEAELLINTESLSFTQERRQIQMREVEITIRDFSMDLDSTICAEPVDEFGNATAEEISTFINCFAADSTGNGLASVRETLKRRLIDDYDEVTAAKMIKLSSTNNISLDATIELVRNTKTAINATNFDSIELELSGDATQEICCSPIAQSHAPTGLDASLDALHTLRDCQNETTLPQSPLFPPLNLSLPRTTSRKRKRALRKNKTTNTELKLSRGEMLTQSEKYLAMIEKEFFKSKEKLKVLKCPLNSLKLSKMFPNMFRKWTKPNAQQISDEYVNIVREIMGYDYEDTMVDEISPTSISKEILQPYQRKIVIRSFTPPHVTPDEVALNMSQTMLDFNANINEQENDSLLASNALFGEITKGPACATMLEVLKICVAQNTYKINLHKFIFQMPNRTEAALAFHNLMELVRDRFIVITTKPGSIEAVNILLCEKSIELIEE